MLQNLSSEERLRVVMENIRDFALVTITLDGHIADWNIGAERMMGYKAAEIIGKPASIIFSPEDRANNVTDQELNKARNEGKALDERWHIRQDGSRFWANGYMEAVKDLSGKLIGFVKVFRDMTTHKKTAEALQKKNEELEQFSAMASHDLQAPLSKIVSFTQLIRQEGVEAAKQHLPDIESSALKMQGLISDLIDLYRAAQLNPDDLKEVDLNQTVHSSLDNLKDLIQEKNPQIEIEKLPVIKANPAHMMQLFQNLLGNAVKYSAATDRKLLIKITSGQKNGFHEIHIEDNGIGFDQAHAEEIFKPFKRLHGGEYEGTGLGLAICKRTVEKYGGEIMVESEKHEGSVFTIKLPVVINIPQPLQVNAVC